MPDCEIAAKTTDAPINKLHSKRESPTQASPDLRIATASDADDHAKNLSCWIQEYNQFSPGVFSGKITELWLPHTQLFLESTNQVLHQSCAAWPDALWFGIPVDNTEPASIGVTPIPHGSVAVKRGGMQFELFTPAEFDILGIVIEEEVFANYVEDVEHLDAKALLQHNDVLAVDPRVKTDASRALLRLLSEGSPPDSSAITLGHEALQDRILMSLVPLLLTATTAETRASPTFLNRHRIVEQVRGYVLAHPMENVSIPDLCRHFHVSRRTLQYCFEDVMGMSPVSYVRMLRLNEVRRELQDSNYYGQVTRVALSWGFHHLSQFSGDYRRMFGMLPSEAARGRANGL